MDEGLGFRVFCLFFKRLVFCLLSFVFCLLSFVFCLSSFVFCLSSFVFSYDVTSNAFQMDLEGNLLTLSDNVQIKAQHYVLNSQEAKMGLDDKKILIEENFTINFREQTINGENLVFDSDQSILTANEVTLKFLKYTLAGNQVNLRKDIVEMNKVNITSCKGRTPIIHMKSSKVDLYPKFGFFVAFNAIVYVNNVPLLWLPAYFMGDRHYSEFANNSLIPEIGSNLVEGAYVKENLPYYMNAENNGMFHLSYLERYGIKTGFQHYSYFEKGRHKINFGLYYAPGLWQGNFDYTTSLFLENKEDQYFLSFLFNDPGLRGRISNIYFSYYIKYNEIINNQFVTIFPGYKISSFWILDRNNSLDASYAFEQIEENNTTKFKKISYDGRLATNFPFLNWGVNNYISYHRSDYPLFNMHERMQNNFVVSLPYENIIFTADYEHPIFYGGSSPFLYDAYDVDAYDKLTFSSKFHFYYFNFEYKIKFRIGKNYYYHRRYELSVPYEGCIDLKLYWEDINKEFGFSVNI